MSLLAHIKDSDADEIIVITVYEPDLSVWEPEFELRRK